jgi:nucleoside-diphosphate-sugar epimerase
VKTEQDPLDHHPPAAVHQSLRAIQELEAMVSGASGISGIVLRYGTFYGPGTTFDTEGEIVEWARQRSFRSLATAPVSGL